jgi:molybdopterin synthase catalytic subunit
VVRIAVNHEHVADDVVLGPTTRSPSSRPSPGAEVVRVQAEPFDAGALIQSLAAGRSDVGAVVSFQGLVRAAEGEAPITALTLEHYPGMTERELERIEAEAHARWPLQASLIVHRYGRMTPGEPIVLVVTASAHRHAAFAAASFLMDWLKTKAPFWKRAETADGERWIDAKSSDDAAAERWR